jgi:hypothetical protein
MDCYSLIVITDETAPIRRFEISKLLVKRGVIGAAAVACMLLLGLVDYVHVRSNQDELHGLREQNESQRGEVEVFEESLAEVEANLVRLRDFERKVRIIANLPGSVATGGEDVFPVEPEVAEELEATDAGAAPSDGGKGGPAAVRAGQERAEAAVSDDSADTDSAQTNTERVGFLQRDAERLGLIAGERELSLAELLDDLEGKRHHLASTPAIWPANGWLTSRFGNRTSPFTGGKQFHGGIDIAGRRGTDVIAPARGKVTFAGKKGGLGRALKIDHGYGIRTTYGHNDKLFVKNGEEVERGQRIAALGSTGRSTGPHLHYVVEVKGKAVNPLDYIFD